MKCMDVKHTDAKKKQEKGQCKERDFSKCHDEMAMKRLHNIGTGHTVEKFNFNRKMVCQDHVTIDLEHRLLGLGERRLLNEDTVPTECVHRTKSPGPKGRCCYGTRRAVSQKGRT